MRSEVTRLRRNASEIAADVQALSHRLHSRKLEYLGMARTFRLTCEEFARQHKMTVAFEAHDVPNHVPPEASLCLYRILQESMRNTARHSGATHMHIVLTGHGSAVELIVRDDGNGFDVEETGNGGIGLLSMRERIAIAAGELSIDSAPGQGTTLRARVPVAE
jgi:signal transduction histidine kinase